MQKKRNNKAKPMQNKATSSNIHPTDPHQSARPTRQPNANKRNTTTTRDTTHALPTPRHNRTRKWAIWHHNRQTNKCLHQAPNEEMEYTHQQSSHVFHHHHHHHRHQTKSYLAFTSQTLPASHSPYTS